MYLQPPPPPPPNINQFPLLNLPPSITPTFPHLTPFQGKWAPRRIPNPGYFEDKTPFLHLLPISAVGFELWSTSPSVSFDNVIVISELAIANNYARDG